jgi:hypothetical protein
VRWSTILWLIASVAFLLGTRAIQDLGATISFDAASIHIYHEAGQLNDSDG